MAKATLVVMAAGIGSRFGGGIKQLEPVGPSGEIIMDYSIYDAMEAGFDKVVFVIRKDLEKDFKEVIGNRIEKVVEVAYAYQEKDDIPEPYHTKYAERKKPWGTGQAILCCKDVVKEPFVVINADDYYGKEAYKVAYKHLINQKNEKTKESISMVGFVLKNTLSDNGSVTRGICKANENNILTDIVETYNIVKTESGAAIRTEDGDVEIDINSLVSMNMWGLQPSFIGILEKGFMQFLKEKEETFQKAEYLLPSIIGGLLRKGDAEVRVLQSNDQWFGVTYKEDKPYVVNAIRGLVDAGIYPLRLFEKNRHTAGGMQMSIFASTDILLPQIESMEAWSVIACDQFTSQPEYWERVRKFVGEQPSTLNLIFPEAELESDKEQRISSINNAMKQYVKADLFKEYKNSYIYIERTMKNGTIRKGIVGVVDLEAYDYSSKATSAIRATEKTVIERIPPRMAIRRDAVLELPHILVFCDDDKKELIETFSKQKDLLEKIYDFNLMEDGGHITGWLVQGTLVDEFDEKFKRYEKSRMERNEMVLAMGDGNHSLATAKACYEELKASDLGKDWSTHPSRYALIELENIHDEAQEFEPIHRILTGVDVSKLVSEIKERICDEKGLAITCCVGETQEVLYLNEELGSLPVGILQTFLDEYLEHNEGVIDYIHGDDVLKGLAKEKDAVGFIVPTIDKTQLFSGISKDGVLPRKTFSMGHAQEKRYYLECRKIK